MDAENPVVKLCAQGMQAEADGRPDDARALFQQAWEQRRDDHDACIAAHFFARHQRTAEETLHWNALALEHARAAPPELVEGFYASLHLCLGNALEGVGRVEEAREQYLLGHAALSAVPEGPYGNVVRGGLKRAMTRVQPQPG